MACDNKRSWSRSSDTKQFTVGSVSTATARSSKPDNGETCLRCCSTSQCSWGSVESGVHVSHVFDDTVILELPDFSTSTVSALREHAVENTWQGTALW